MLPSANELRHASGRVERLEARTMEVLVLLHRRSGEVVPVAEILDRVWEGRIVSDHSVAIVISDLRKALGDDARSPTYIETIPKRGYRLLAPAEPGTSPAAGSRPSRTLVAGAIGGLLLALGLLLGLRGRTTLGEGPIRGPCLDPTAQEQLFLARELWSRRSDEAVHRALGLLQGLVRSHPDCAPARALLAMIYAHKTGEHLGMPALDTFREAQRLLDRAKAIDSGLAETHLAQALLDFYRDQQPRKALRSVEQAVAEAPRSALVWQTRAMILSALGEHEQSLADIERARGIDPVSAAIAWDRVWFLYLAGRPREARDALAEAAAESGGNLLYEALIARELGERRRSLELWVERTARKGLELPDPQRIRTLAHSSLPDAYAELLRQTDGVVGYRDYPGVRAVWQLDAGDPEAAVTTLVSAPPTRDHWMVLWLHEIPAFASLRDRPEMRALFARIGVAPRTAGGATEHDSGLRPATASSPPAATGHSTSR